MQLDTFESSLQRRAATVGLEYKLRTPIAPAELSVAMAGIHANIPAPIATFYQYCNGFSVASPHLVVHPVNSLALDGDFIPFAIFDRKHHIAFDTSQLNVAGEWDIVNTATRFCLTHTLASFITNKTWAWIDRQRRVWLDEFNVDRQTT